MRSGVDFHVHTREGSCESEFAEVVVKKAIEANLQALAITDHCSVSGIEHAIEAAENDIEIVPGVELDAMFEDKKVHILAYFVEYDNDVFLRNLRNISQGRRNRMVKIVENFAEKGLIPENDVSGIVYGVDQDKIYTKNAVAERLVWAYFPLEDSVLGKEIERLRLIKDYTTPKGTPKGDIDIFSKFMYEFLGSSEGSFDAPYEAPHVVEVMDFCKKWDLPWGYAHIGSDMKDEGKVKTAVEVGVMSDMQLLGVGHKGHDMHMTKYLSKLSREHNLIPVNGSDYHAKKGEPKIGEYRSPYSVLERMRELKK